MAENVVDDGIEPSLKLRLMSNPPLNLRLMSKFSFKLSLKGNLPVFPRFVIMK